MKKVSIITSLYAGDEHIQGFMENITNQSIFKDCELVIVNANSPHHEEDVIFPYLKNENIKYIKLNTRVNVHVTMNIAIENSSSEYIAIANVDDRRTVKSLELQAKALDEHDVDLVYGNSLVTRKANQNPDTYVGGKMFEHSLMPFSKENMVKCLPGPFPMWKRTMTDKNGKFDESMKFAGDWEFWLRCVSNGSVFHKINEIVGLYYHNPNGLTTNIEFESEKFLEERSVYSKYRELFGKNFYLYKNYFRL